MSNNNNAEIPLELRVLETIKERKPQLRNEVDAVVAFLHCVMRELGFICTSLGEEPNNNDDVFDKQVFPEGWNQSSDIYSFQYKHTQSAMTFFVKYLLINGKLLVHGVAKETNNVQSLELTIKDFISEKAQLNNPYELYKDMDKLSLLFKTNISSRLLPNLNKPGYEDPVAQRQTTTTTSTQQQQQQQQQQPQQPPRRDPLIDPRFDRPYDPLRIPGSGRGPTGGYLPQYGVGYGDILPPPGPGFGIPGQMGGNLIGPGHPGFGPRVNDPYASDPFGVGGPRLPRGAVPPGARFDPFGPPAAPNFPPPPGGNRFGPDNDELPPPGYNDMYL